MRAEMALCRSKHGWRGRAGRPVSPSPPLPVHLLPAGVSSFLSHRSANSHSANVRRRLSARPPSVSLRARRPQNSISPQTLPGALHSGALRPPSRQAPVGRLIGADIDLPLTNLFFPFLLYLSLLFLLPVEVPVLAVSEFPPTLRGASFAFSSVMNGVNGLRAIFRIGGVSSLRVLAAERKFGGIRSAFSAAISTGSPTRAVAIA